MPDLVRLVHGNKIGINRLIAEFRHYWHQLNASSVPSIEQDEIGNADSNTKYKISKRQLEKKIQSIATYENRPSLKGRSWYVNDKILDQYQLQNLPIPTQWVYTSKVVKE